MESAFAIIAEPNRRAILRLLVSSQQSVGEIERRLRLPQPSVSKHLRVLREAGFVESTVDAQRRLYRLKPEPLQEVAAWLAPFRRFWSAHVDALERHPRPHGPVDTTERENEEKTMNVLLWILQVALALLYLAGGSYKVFKFDELATHLRALPRSGWRVLGVLEMVCAILLVVPAAAKWMPMLTPLAAAALALETLALAGLYARYSLKLAATNPMVWAVVMGLVAAFVAYGRYVLSPLV